jgi:3',5'-cyclic AMP phosphodiesterase CpdA
MDRTALAGKRVVPAFGARQMLLCQITDLHVTAGRVPAYGRVDTAACLERCVQRIAGLDPRPDLVIATGDLVDEPSAQSYGLLREILGGLRQPVYLLPGNHDERRALLAAFPDHGYLQGAGDFLQYAIGGYPIRLVALDTVIPGQPGGALCSQRLQWLERRLGESDAPTVIALHHPPFFTGIGHMDQMALGDPSHLERIVRRHPQVQRIVCGHLHRPIQTLFAGTLASVCPSTAHQVLLDLKPGSAARFVMEPPAFQLHWWNGQTLVSHTMYTGDYQGPYPFDD